MIDLAFSVYAKVTNGQTVRVVGSTAQLGSWNPQNSLVLSPRKGLWEGTLYNVDSDVRLEFKLVKVKQNGEIEWQQLPQNSNRKFKPKFSTQIHLQWNEPAGRINSISKDSFKLNGLPAAMLNKSKQFKKLKEVKISEEFDPYLKARDDSDEENQEQLLIIRRRMSEQININSKDMEETYNKNSSVQILVALMKKIKIYVISSDLQSPSNLHHNLEDELTHLPANYLARWITPESIFKDKSEDSLSNKIKRNGSLFEVGPQELYLQSLYSRTSYYLILDLGVAFSLNKVLSKVSCCLYISDSKLKEVINNLPHLNYIDLICFDSVQANIQFYNYLKSKEVQITHEESQMEILSKQTPSIQSIVLELQKLKYRETEVVNTVHTLTPQQLQQVLSTPNSICIIDSSLFEEKDITPEMVMQLKDRKTMILIVCEEDISSKILQTMKDKSNVFVYDGFNRIRLQGKQYYPLRSFHQILEQLKMASKIYKDTHGGEIIEKENSLFYFLPEGKENTAKKIEEETKKVVSKFAFVKVNRKGCRIKISWNLSKQARLIRTLSELKYVNMGELGDFNILTKRINLKELKDNITILIELLPQLFINGSQTKINDFEFGTSSYQKQASPFKPQSKIVQ